MAKEINKENEAVATAVSKVEVFFDTYKKLIWGIILAVVIIAAAGYCYYKFVYAPAKNEALGQMYVAEANFRKGDFSLALKGDGNVLGFEQIIQDYGKKAGKAVYLYAAACEMKLDNPDGALAYLAGYSTSDKLMAARAESLKGDAYCDKEEYAKAAAAFEKAAGIDDNIFSAEYLVKAGQAYEAAGQPAKALVAYKNVKDNYPQSWEAQEIDKYITRIEFKEE